MRELKFKRVHFDCNNKVIDVTTWGKLEDGMFQSPSSIAKEIKSKAIDLQLSCLQDGNGTDIYDGDIYKTNAGGDKSYWQVFFKYGCWCGGRTFESSIPLAYDNYEQMNGDCSWLFVVGNIYETPELLTH